MNRSRCDCIDAFKKGSDAHGRHHRRSEQQARKGFRLETCLADAAGKASTIAEIEIYNDNSREGYDAKLRHRRWPRAAPDMVLTQISNVCGS